MRSRPKALQEPKGLAPSAAERARCRELHIGLGVRGDLRPALDLEAGPLIYDKGALCVAEACERSAGASRAWKASASLRVSGITPGHFSLSQ